MDNSLFIFLCALLEAVPYVYFQLLPFKGNTRVPLWLAMVINSVLMTLASTFITIGYDAGVIPHGMLLILRVIQLSVMLILSTAFIKGERFKMLFTFFASFPYMSAVSAISRFIAQYISPDYNVQLRALVVVQALITLVLFYPALLLWRHTVVLPLGTEKEDFWRTSFIIPLAISIVDLLSMEYGGLAIEISIFKMLERVALLGCIISCSYFTVHVRRQVAHRDELVERSRRDRLLLDVQQQQYDMLAEYIEKSRTARHDFKHHVIALKSLCEQNDIEKVREYLNSATVDMPTDLRVNVSPNRTTNAIFDYYLKKAKDAGITFKMDMRISEDFGFSDSDLCIMLGNILENAIEGCLTVEKEKRFIRIGSSEHAGRLFLTFDNSYDGVFKPGIKGNALSRKRDYVRTGVGIRSIKAVVEKYGGTMQIEAKEDVFCLSLVLVKKDQ